MSDPDKEPLSTVEQATADEQTIQAEIEADAEAAGKDPAAVSLGRRGGLKGGAARAKALTPEKRKESARKAAAARWRKSS